jgi:hypothetical protein
MVAATFQIAGYIHISWFSQINLEYQYLCSAVHDG